ncbi:hypothetical protein BGZ89_006733, partial [Linnemannia elongata]
LQPRNFYDHYTNLILVLFKPLISQLVPITLFDKLIRAMQLKSIIALSICVCLVTQAETEAVVFGPIVGIIRSTIQGAYDVIGTINADPGFHAQGGIICPNQEFEAKVVSVNALCRLEGEESNESCRQFGEKCIGMKGKWGCGNFDGEDDRGCLFRPRFSPAGTRASKIVFDDEAEHRERGDAGSQCVFGRRVGRSALGGHNTVDDGDDETGDKELGFSDENSFLATSVISEVTQYEAIYNELRNIEEEAEEQAGVSSMVLTIAVMLAKKGFTPPMPKWSCSPCKGTCNALFFFKPSWKNACKYDVCVKYLGGYKGSQSQPSCNVL